MSHLTLFLGTRFFVRSQRLEIYVCTFLATPADGMHVMEKTMRGEDCVDKVKILTVVVHGGGRQIDKNTYLGFRESEMFAFKNIYKDYVVLICL